MRIESQVCALDQAKRLKELGVSQDSEFFFASENLMHVTAVADWGNQELVHEALKAHPRSSWYRDEVVFAAFTSAELGEMLGSECNTVLEPGIEMHVWHCSSDDYEVMFPADTEAQAKADLLIWLLEKGHRTAEEVNEALAAA